MPRRRCIGCGRIAPKSELMRLALAPESGGRPARAVLDRTRKMSGRGAYLCVGEIPGEPAAVCLALAERRGGIARALRRPVTIDPKLLESTGQ